MLLKEMFSRSAIFKLGPWQDSECTHLRQTGGAILQALSCVEQNEGQYLHCLPQTHLVRQDSPWPFWPSLRKLQDQTAKTHRPVMSRIKHKLKFHLS